MNPTNLSNRFAAKLRALRTRSGMTQQEFAKALRLDQAHLSKLERGERLPSWHTLRRIARATSGPQETFDLLLLS